MDGFAAQINSITQEMLSLQGFSFKLNLQGFDGHQVLSPKNHHHLTMIYKEALQNIIKHGDLTTPVSIDFIHEAGAFDLLLKNGISKARHPEPGSDRGLQNMKDRAASLGGKIDFNKTDNLFELHLTIGKLS